MHFIERRLLGLHFSYSIVDLYSISWMNMLIVLFSECLPGFYGANCTEECDCANNATCDPKNGRCRCEPGWRGRRCDLSNALLHCCYGFYFATHMQSSILRYNYIYNFISPSYVVAQHKLKKFMPWSSRPICLSCHKLVLYQVAV